VDERSAPPLRFDGGATRCETILARLLLHLALLLRYNRSMNESARGSAAIGSLDEIRRILGLSERELGALFGVSRQAIGHWREHGVPAGRGADVDRISELARFLERELEATRIPQIVRTPGRDKDDGLRGRSMLAAIRAEGLMPIYRHLERLFSFTGA